MNDSIRIVGLATVDNARILSIMFPPGTRAAARSRFAKECYNASTSRRYPFREIPSCPAARFFCPAARFFFPAARFFTFCATISGIAGTPRTYELWSVASPRRLAPAGRLIPTRQPPQRFWRKCTSQGSRRFVRFLEAQPMERCRWFNRVHGSTLLRLNGSLGLEDGIATQCPITSWHMNQSVSTVAEF